MDLLQTIISYYHGEAKHGLWAAVIGGLLLIGGLLFLKWASPLSLLKGISVPMLLFGLLVGIGGGADSLYTRKTTPEKIALYQKNATAFLKQENVKVEKTHRGWHGIQIFWGILGLGGLLLSFLIRKPFWMGAGLGTVALAIFILLFELYSMRFNDRYYKIIQSATAQEPNINTSEINTGTQQQIKAPQITIESSINKQIKVTPTSDTLSAKMLPLDSLKKLSVEGITAIAIKDSIIISTSDSLQQSALTNEEAPEYLIDKKKEVIDYYNATNDVKVKHCRFGKKSLKNKDVSNNG